VSFKYSIILPFMGQLKDRFSFYQKQHSLEEKFALVDQVEGVGGVEMVYPDELSDVALAKELLAKYNLRLSAVNVNLKGDSCWHQGALTARDKATRQKAVSWLQHGLDIAAELDSNLVTVCPLADGHDYPFEIDYAQAWRKFIEGIQAAADYRPDVRLSVEYKASEPRARVIIGNVSKSLYACTEVDRTNIGVTLDMGHALYGGEDCAESVSLLAQAGKLFLVHGNDNYRNWDWDLIPGIVNFWDLIESTFYLRKFEYDSWVAFDVFPARLDPVETMRSSMRMYRLAQSIIEKIGQETLAHSIETANVPQTMALFQSYLEERFTTGE
jgi:xylose isomerase